MAETAWIAARHPHDVTCPAETSHNVSSKETAATKDSRDLRIQHAKGLGVVDDKSYHDPRRQAAR
jgi:hypothetical protein